MSKHHPQGNRERAKFSNQLTKKTYLMAECESCGKDVPAISLYMSMSWMDGMMICVECSLRSNLIQKIRDDLGCGG